MRSKSWRKGEGVTDKYRRWLQGAAALGGARAGGPTVTHDLVDGLAPQHPIAMERVDNGGRRGIRRKKR
jgi:hypothetical protein